MKTTTFESVTLKIFTLLFMFGLLMSTFSLIFSDPSISYAWGSPGPNTKLIYAKSLDKHECDANDWDFVITGITNGVKAPDSIKVEWDGGASKEASLKKVSGEVAHYDTAAHLNDTIKSAEVYIDKTWSGEFNLSKGPCSGGGTTPTTGSITICKAIIDDKGNIVDGSAADGTFSIAGLNFDNPAGVLATTTFTAPLTFNKDIFSGVSGNDVQCVRYDNLALGSYYYGQETITSSSTWMTPLYNDQNTTSIKDTSDFYPYSGELFTPDTSDDASRNTNADGNIVLTTSRPDRTLVVLNQYKKPAPQPKQVTVVATKIVCNKETDLPNWSGTSTAISATTASDFLNTHPDCYLKEGWTFQYADASTTNPGDNTATSSAWTTFGPTDGNGVATTSVTDPAIFNKNYLWVREIMRDGYVPFTGVGGSDVSAEFYCATDVLNYDNYDRIDNLEDGKTYYCIGLNAPKVAPPQCSDHVNNDNDNFIDSADPGCHTDGDPNNPNSYNPNGNSENEKPVITLIGSSTVTVAQNGTYTEKGAHVNDPEDGSIDGKLVIDSSAVDTGTVGSYTVTYNATDSQNLAADQVTRTVNVIATTECSDGQDNDNDGLVDSADPGCWTDQSDPNTYDPNIDSENAKPIITLNGNPTVTLTVGDSYTDVGATAHDQEDGDITGKIITVDPVDTNTAGTYTITYNATDSQNVAADEVTRTVTVNPVTPPTTQCNDGIDNDGDKLVDSADPGCHTDGDPNNPNSYNPNGNSENEKPIITLIGSPTVDVVENTTYTDAGATANDPEDGPRSVLTVNSVDTSTLGTYTVTYNATDSQDLAADQVTRTVNVVLPPSPGVIHICKIIVDHNNQVATTSAGLPAGTFSVALATSTEIATTTIDTTSWDAATFAPNRVFTTTNNDNDADCVTFSNLPLGTYYYGQEAISGSQWATATVGYNDGDVAAVNNVFDFTSYDNALFTATTTDDAGRDQNADGSVTLTSGRYERTIVIRNQYVPAQCSDGIDNDGDKLVDSADPGCHTDGDPNNPNSYNPNGNSENEKPVITLLGNPTVDLTVGDVYNDAGATATDPEDGPVPVVTVDPVNTSVAGTYTITYNATDSQNLAADQVTRTVTVKNPTPPTPPSCTNCGGGGGGGGGGPIQTRLTIFNEKVTVVSEGAAVITWDTNLPASSRVVYDTVSHTESASVLNFGVDGVNFGYASSTTEDPARTTHHSVLVTNVNLKDTFYFRPVSVATSRAIGNELSAVLGQVSLGGTCTQYLHEFIKVGQNNNPEEVTKLQKFLNKFENDHLTVNGVYDPATVAAVNAFQDKYASDVLTPWGLPGHTGYVYITTRKKINEIYCDEQVAFPLTDAQKTEIAAFRALQAAREAQGLPPLPATGEVGEAPSQPSAPGLAQAGTGETGPSVTFTEEGTTTSGARGLAAGSEGTSSLASAIEANQATSSIFQEITNFFLGFFR